MRKITALLPVFALIILTFVGLTSCNRGSGCTVNEGVHVKPNKKGQYPKSKTRSGLFPKDMKKKTKVN